jgi:phospholipase/lecithinase/hemolysin
MIVPFRHSGALRRTHAVVLALAVLLPGAARAQGGFTSLTFFGNSSSDTGNLLQLTGGAQPPSSTYYMGRFSNGPNWVDYFATALGRPDDARPAFVANAGSGNYAIGGARTTGTNPPGTDAQIGRYLTRPGTVPGTLTDPTGLYVLLAGGNDLRDAGTLSDAVARQSVATTAAQRVLTQAGQLAGAGARSVLLFTLPNLGLTPEALSIPGRSGIEAELSAMFNGTLAAGLPGLQAMQPLTTFYDLRLDNLFTNILLDTQAGGRRYGLTNAATPCLGSSTTTCDMSVFYDNLHLTTHANQLVAAAAYTYVTTGVNVAAVPEPETGALVGGGVLLLVFGAVRRRARAA